MFKFFKDKLKNTISRFSKKVEEEAVERPEESSEGEAVEEPAEEKPVEAVSEDGPQEPLPETDSSEDELPEKEPDAEEHITEKSAEPVKEDAKQVSGEPAEKAGFFSKFKKKISTTKINEKDFEEMFNELEIGLLESNVAVEIIEKIKLDLKGNLVDKPIARAEVEDIVKKSLARSLQDVLDIDSIDVMARIKEKKPYVIAFVGINGSGKTTTIAKFANMLKDNGLKAVLAAADTFRAASIEQLETHGSRLGIKVIKHDYGSDPAAVAFDAVKYAKAKDLDVVLIDTAGRMHSNSNLIDEMKKIIRVAQPDLKIFVGESITGNDCVEQAKTFNDAIGIDGIILSKADIDEKGGAAISVSYVTNRPILYIGTGQEYKDLQKFSSDIVLESVGLEA